MDKRKLILRISGIAIGGIAIYLIVNKIRKKIIYNKIVNSMNPPNSTTSGSAAGATITTDEALTIAKKLYVAFRPGMLTNPEWPSWLQGFGTNEKVIKDLLTPLNKSDLILVTQQFGTRDGMNLAQYLQSELSGSDLDYVRSLYQKAGLNFS